MNDDELDKLFHDGSFSAWQAKTGMTIAKHGHQLISVFSGEDDPEPGPGFTYTIGLYPKVGYELIVFALPYAIAGFFLNTMAENMRKGVEYGPNMKIENLANMPLLLMEADDRARGYMCQADQYYETEVRTLQLVLPDRSGKFPGEAGYDEKYMNIRQPLLYTP